MIGGEASFAPVLRTLAAMRSYSIEPAKLRELQDADSGTVSEERTAATPPASCKRSAAILPKTWNESVSC